MSDEPEIVGVPPVAPVAEGQTDIRKATQRTVFVPFPESFVYSNCCAFAITQMEVRLGFAEALQDGKAIPKIGIVMPPEAAAVIALVLLEQVKAYEANFGEIRHPMWKAAKAGEDTSPFAPKPAIE